MLEASAPRPPRNGLVLALLLVLLTTLGFDTPPTAGELAPPPRVSGPLEQSAYLWQRRWNGEVSAAIERHAEHGQLGELLILAAELDGPELTTIAWDPEALARVESVGLAIRIGPWSGPFGGPNDPVLPQLLATVRTTLERAREAGLDVRELQLDFDAASRRLHEYARWVAAVREIASPTPVTITALPDWLNQPALPELLAHTDGWVLQVHGLRPMSAELLDADAARSAVERAAVLADELDRPFRVALPTYTYLIARDPATGDPLGIAAEQAPRQLPRDRFARAEAAPAVIAELVASWTLDRPAALRGIVWFRLPVEGDRLAWSWPTLSAVMDGRAPREQLELRRCTSGTDVVELTLHNAGEADLWLDAAIPLPFDTPPLASDGLAGFELTDRLLIPTEHIRLAAGERREVAWLRFAELAREELQSCPSP
jgi:hypothetical protein